MTLKLSSTNILASIVGAFMLLLLGTLIYSLKVMDAKYRDYKIRTVKNNPYESYAKITGKYPMGGGFEIEYQFGGKSYNEVMKVKNSVYKQYKIGDKIPIMVSRNNPEMVIAPSP